MSGGLRYVNSNQKEEAVSIRSPWSNHLCVQRQKLCERSA